MCEDISKTLSIEAEWINSVKNQFLSYKLLGKLLGKYYKNETLKRLYISTAIFRVSLIRTCST